SIAIVRNISAMLRPSVLDIGVPDTLEWLAARFSARTHIHCQVHIYGEEPEFSENHAIAIFRIVQESLSNVALHASASHVDITLERDSAYCVLRIRDNGCGFDTSLKMGNALGLLGIRERAFTLGGSVSIESSVGNGTEIVVRISKPAS
ncbi:MAG: GGDEF family protein, partial [Comamonadaceae bacterium]